MKKTTHSFANFVRLLFPWHLTRPVIEDEIIHEKMKAMNNIYSFAVHFITRPGPKDLLTIYARIKVNRTSCELSIKQSIEKLNWNGSKGLAFPKTQDLKLLNRRLELIRSEIVQHYNALTLKLEIICADDVKNAFLGISQLNDIKSLLWLAAEHNKVMKKVLKPGSLKNYFTTEKYLKLFLTKRYKNGDVELTKLNYEFIATFDNFIRFEPIKDNDPCTNNGTMKHLERLKKMVNWAVKNEWLEKNPFISYRLKYQKHHREFLNELELLSIQSFKFQNPMLEKVRDFFIFSCFTGLSFIDLTELKPQHLLSGVDGAKWIKTTRAKTDTPVNVPILKPALDILNKYQERSSPGYVADRVFPKITNQEINRYLKVIAELCQIPKYLTFHLARHTFATTVTLMNGVPIETISKMLGHTKLSTTMIYAKVTQTKIGMDMESLQNILDAKSTDSKMKVVK